MSRIKEVLITGGDGFTGKYVEQELKARGFRVVNLEERGTKYENIDLRDKLLLKERLSAVKANFIVHLAAISNTQHKPSDDFYTVNTIGTDNLLSAIQETQPNVEGVVLASSANVYGQGCSGVPISEDTPLNPLNHYAVSKVAMEYVVSWYRKYYPITILRPFNYIGIGQKENFVVPKIVSAFRNKLPSIDLGDVDAVRDFSDVRDVAKIYALVLEKKCFFPIINICSGQSVSIREIVSRCSKLTGQKINIVKKSELCRRNDASKVFANSYILDKIFPKDRRYTLDETLEWMLKTG